MLEFVVDSAGVVGIADLHSIQMGVSNVRLSEGEICIVFHNIDHYTLSVLDNLT